MKKYPLNYLLKKSNSYKMQLEDLFFSVFKNSTASTLYTEECFLFLKKKYSQESRHYHNLDHLEFMFKELQEFPSTPNHKEALILSIFYHDIIYKSSKKDNEYQSALILEKHLSKTTFNKVELCKNQIIATQLHEKSNTDTDTNLLIDLDLSILGQDHDSYLTYTEKIRKEYKSYPNFIYKPARKKAMQNFLEQDSIFKTTYFIEKYELTARDNINKEIQSL